MRGHRELSQRIICNLRNPLHLHMRYHAEVFVKNLETKEERTDGVRGHSKRLSCENAGG